MAKDPAMLFYTSDFLTGVALMSMKERGQYITLLCLQQQRGHMTATEMRKAVGPLSEEVLGKFVSDEDGKLFNPRAEEEINKRAAHCKRQADKIRKRWEVPGEYQGNTTVLPLENENEIIKRDRGSGGKRGRFAPPTVEEVAAYCAQRKNGINPQRFVDFYASKGWKVGNQPMKDWRAAVRTWEQRDKSEAQKRAPKASSTYDIAELEEMSSFDVLEE